MGDTHYLTVQSNGLIAATIWFDCVDSPPRPLVGLHALEEQAVSQLYDCLEYQDLLFEYREHYTPN